MKIREFLIRVILPIGSYYFIELTYALFSSNIDVKERSLLLIIVAFFYSSFAGAIIWLIANMIAFLSSLNGVKQLTSIFLLLFGIYNLIPEKRIIDILQLLLFIVINVVIIIYFFIKKCNCQN